MKKFTSILWITVVLLFVNANLFAQKSSNPFSVKQKVTTGNSIANPSPLTNINVVADRSTSKGSFTFNSTAFKIPLLKNQYHFTQANYDKNGLLSFVSCSHGEGASYVSRSEESMKSAAFEFMDNVKQSMRINNPEQEFQPIQLWNDDLGFDHVKMQQYYKGIKVYGGQVIIHGSNGFVNTMNGTYFPTPKLDFLKPDVSSQDAIETVRRDVSKTAQIEASTLSKDNPLYYKETESELVIYHFKLKLDNEKLVWHITFRPNVMERWEYFVDAGTGVIINKYDNTCSDGPVTANTTDLNGVTRTINTYLVGGNYYMINITKSMYNASQSQLPNNPVGGIWTLDARNSNSGDIYQVSSSNNTWSDASSVSAHYNASITYDYYMNTHGRNSIDGNGGTIISVVNRLDKYGNNMANAFWNGKAMFYGNGGGILKPLAGAEDVGAHEMTHGVIQKTANLEYQYESGAINESMADIGGAMVDRSNWQIGEKIIPAGSPYYPTGTLRDMSNPHNGGSSFSDPSYQPSHLSEKYVGEKDEGGVHINSGIINFAYYKIAEAISKGKAEKLFYRALTTYLTKSSQFIDCRLAFEQAAKDIYGNNSTELGVVSNAFYEVGIGDPGTNGGGTGSDAPGEIAVNPGQDYVLSYDVSFGNQNTLFRSSTTGVDFVAVSQTMLKRKPSLVDNGSWGVMISENSEMISISMSDPFEEQIISQETIWDNVAVSKDGKRIAAITTAIDSAIWVYDVGLQSWAKYHLYSPTFTTGETVDNVLYADAIEWDYTGQYLVFDAYNEMVNNDGQNIDYWDVGVIKVWDNVANSWGDGVIEKVFSNLPEGVSIGNPSFSKNSPYIIAFDYFNATDNSVAVLGTNLETGDVATIYENNDLGFPNYSKLDDIVVFGTNYNNKQVVGEIAMQNDKINSTGSAYLLIDYAKWPVWYATGNRNLTGIEEKVTKSDFFSNVYPNPAYNNVSAVFKSEKIQPYTVSVYNVFGQLLINKTGSAVNGLNKIALHLESLTNGTYMVKITLSSSTKVHKIIKAGN